MRIRFWGTRGSIAKPGPTTLRYGGNTSCVEVRTNDGTLIVLDCGTGAHGLGRALVGLGADAKRGHLLISHTHWDHIQGFPFFAPLRLPDSEWNVYGPRAVASSLRETLAGQMNYVYFPVDLAGLDARLHFHDLIEGVFELGDVRVEARYLNHPAVTLGYRLEADGVVVVYATDHEPHSRRLAVGEEDLGPVKEDDTHASFLEGADLVIHDTQYTAEEYPTYVGYGHSTVEYVVDRTLDKGIRRLALFHHDPMRDDRGVDRLVGMAQHRLAARSQRMDVLAAAEGLTLELEPRPVGPRLRRGGPSARLVPRCGILEQEVVLAARDPLVAQTFRDAAEADDVSLREEEDLARVFALVEELSPSLIIAEREILGSDVARAARALREAAGTDGAPPTLVGLVEESEFPVSQYGLDGGLDEWVVTPLTGQYARSRLRAWLLRTACRWRRAPLPVDEAARIEALHALRILDTPPEERFDRYTRIASALFNVPIALVSLVDRDRQWFKSRHGLSVDETPRDRAFCAHAILGADVFQVKDALLHPDFSDNPLVTGPPHVRFYAGVPLRLRTGEPVGTLCLIDRNARELSDTELELLRDLGRLVEGELEHSAGP